MSTKVKEAIEAVVNEFDLPGINSFLALLSVQDPFFEKPEETYARIEDFVIDNLDSVVEKAKKMLKLIPPPSNPSVWFDVIARMVAFNCVQYIMEKSQTLDSILTRYSMNGIQNSVGERVTEMLKLLSTK